MLNDVDMRGISEHKYFLDFTLIQFCEVWLLIHNCYFFGYLQPLKHDVSEF